MFEETPRTFENVVQRDVWLWKHLTVGLLTEIEQYRLLNMPNPDADRTTATQWQNYARSVAELLAKQGRWAEVQAYYLASIFTMSHANKGRTPEFWETATEAVRSAGYSAGMPPVEEATTMAEVVAVGIKSSIMPVPESIVRSLVIIGTIRDSVYDEAELSGESRRIFSQLLPTVYPQIKTSLSDANGSHEQFRVAVSAYSNNISQLRTLIDQWSENQTVEHIRRSRESLLKQLARINDYLLPYDKNVVVNIQKLLGTHFSSYEKSHAELQEDVGYEQLLEFWKSYFENIQEIGSHFSSCYAAPLMLSVGEAITGHYQGLIHSKYPDLLIQIVKPAARQAIDLSRLDIEIRNEGTAPANNCDFHIKASADECVFSDFPDQYIGTLGPNESKIVSCGIRCEVDQEVFELPCSLEWNDRSGSHSKDDILKITRQRDIDWAAFTALPAPYTIQSITNPSKLKGRNDLLQNLRLGFLGNASFMVTGQKRVGKTSLIRVFLSELAKQDGLLTLYVPLGELSAAGNTDDVGRLGVDLVQRIVEEYEERFDGLVNIPIPPVAEFRDAFNTTFTRFIRQFLKVYPVRLAFAIDDLDELPTQLFQGSAGKAFFLALRSLIDRGTSFFFIGSERLELRWFGGHSMICRRANLRRCPDAESSCALSPRVQD